ncbi:hypothetical protein [Microbacterium sp. WCS2018Hpa-23]|uniref:hypothetical protein n=1 Tax=Microbacterium sp. WCS2018Hpa-23 TaxID=3073634 RepID=UPI0028833606|nr:hypothetical protein [Microbacterium sp. WCS2018Hpa-23]
MTDQPDPSAPRQKVVRVPGSRRARLTPVPGTDIDPETAATQKPIASAPRVPKGPKGPNDDRLMQDVPPHY